MVILPFEMIDVAAGFMENAVTGMTGRIKELPAAPDITCTLKNPHDYKSCSFRVLAVRAFGSCGESSCRIDLTPLPMSLTL